MDLLTPSINVPAERQKLRALRNEIAADVALREAYQHKYSPRGFPLLPDVHPMEAQGKPGHGPASNGALRAWAGVGVSSAEAHMRTAQAGCRGCCCCACGVGKGGVN